MVSANQNNLMTTVYLLDANTTLIAAVLLGLSKSLRMFYVVISIISITAFSSFLLNCCYPSKLILELIVSGFFMLSDTKV